jgi:carboxymethylenebutenolidase
MKHLFLPLSIIFVSMTLAHGQSCCMKKTPCDGMVAFASNQDFKDAHTAPEPIDFKAETGKMITFATPDGKTGTAFAIPSPKPSAKILFIFHEWWGLNDHIKREAELWQKMLGDVHVYALDLYDGKVATVADSAGKYMMGMKPERAASIVEGLVSYATSNKQTEIATLGWCMGGSWSYQGAVIAGNKAKACVMYYGFPDGNIEKLKTLKTEVLYIQALQDAFIKSEAVEKFAQDFKTAGKSIDIKKYDAVHAFANPSNPKFNKEASAEAQKLSLAFIKKGLNLK